MGLARRAHLNLRVLLLPAVVLMSTLSDVAKAPSCAEEVLAWLREQHIGGHAKCPRTCILNLLSEPHATPEDKKFLRKALLQCQGADEHPPVDEAPEQTAAWQPLRLAPSMALMEGEDRVKDLQHGDGMDTRHPPATEPPTESEGENSIPSKKQETICVQVILKWVRERSMGYRTRGCPRACFTTLASGKSSVNAYPFLQHIAADCLDSAAAELSDGSGHDSVSVTSAALIQPAAEQQDTSTAQTQPLPGLVPGGECDIDGHLHNLSGEACVSAQAIGALYSQHGAHLTRSLEEVLEAYRGNERWLLKRLLDKYRASGPVTPPLPQPDNSDGSSTEVDPSPGGQDKGAKRVESPWPRLSGLVRRAASWATRLVAGTRTRSDNIISSHPTDARAQPPGQTGQQHRAGLQPGPATMKPAAPGLARGCEQSGSDSEEESRLLQAAALAPVVLARSPDVRREFGGAILLPTEPGVRANGMPVWSAQGSWLHLFYSVEQGEQGGAGSGAPAGAAGSTPGGRWVLCVGRGRADKEWAPRGASSCPSAAVFAHTTPCRASLGPLGTQAWQLSKRLRDDRSPLSQMRNKPWRPRQLTLLSGAAAAQLLEQQQHTVHEMRSTSIVIGGDDKEFDGIHLLPAKHMVNGYPAWGSLCAGRRLLLVFMARMPRRTGPTREVWVMSNTLRPNTTSGSAAILQPSGDKLLPWALGSVPAAEQKWATNVKVMSRGSRVWYAPGVPSVGTDEIGQYACDV